MTPTLAKLLNYTTRNHCSLAFSADCQVAPVLLVSRYTGAFFPVGPFGTEMELDVSNRLDAYEAARGSRPVRCT